MVDTTTIKLPDCGHTVTIGYLYGDQRAVENASNVHVTWDEGTKKTIVAPEYFPARRDAILRAVPKSWDASTPLTMDAIDKLSIKDGSALEKACMKLVNDAEAVAKPDSPKGKK